MDVAHHPLVDAAVARHGESTTSLLPILQEVQCFGGSLGKQEIAATAEALRLSQSQVLGVASFYSLLSTQPRTGHVVRLCDGPVCQLAGSERLRALLPSGLDDTSPWCILRTSCLGLCDRAPAALVDHQPCGPLSAEKLVEVPAGWRGVSPSYSAPREGECRIALARLGRVDPESLDSAVSFGAYQTLLNAVRRSSQDVLEAIDQSGLQGRGGAGFPTGKKWRAVAVQDATSKFVVCNADESEPGVFKDRVLLEGDPHLMLEGLALCAYAVGASEGFVYVRGEYAPAADRLERAIAQAETAGYLGERIGGSEFALRLHVHRGAGAYICGEETALLESLEGRRGEPRPRPPYPTAHGYLGQPTVVNNVETLCHVPAIVRQGPHWYRSLGTATSPGTKLFTVLGHVQQPGCFEAPFGITLREAIERFGGGMRPGARFKMALTGGAAGTIVPAASLDVPLDITSGRAGVQLGSGAIIAMDESVSAAELLLWLLWFFENESCGKCTPCREGTRAVRQRAERLAAGRGQGDDLAELARFARLIHDTSLCGLGQSVAWPIETALRHFPEDFADIPRNLP